MVRFEWRAITLKASLTGNRKKEVVVWGSNIQQFLSKTKNIKVITAEALKNK